MEEKKIMEGNEKKKKRQKRNEKKNLTRTPTSYIAAHRFHEIRLKSEEKTIIKYRVIHRKNVIWYFQHYQDNLKLSRSL